MGKNIITGTNHNDHLVGQVDEENVFQSFGVGSDTGIGGKANDYFYMSVDKFVDYVDGRGGEDTIDFSHSSHMMHIDLSTGHVSANFGWLQNSTFLGNWQEVAEVKNVEDVVGSRYNDIITGSAADNRIDGGGGNDTIHAGAGNDLLIAGHGSDLLDGGTGTDTVDYSTANNSVNVELANGGGNGSGEVYDWSTGTALTHDTLVNIENVNGSDHDDNIYGNSSDNVINGDGGNDILHTGGGNDTIHGGDGNDVIDTRDGNYNETGGTNHFYGDAGMDTIEGGSGTDYIDGGSDNDWLYGNGGNDVLTGGDGNDWLDGGAGADSIDGGTGINTVSYENSQAGVYVNLETQSATGGDATGDTLANIQNIFGSATGNDVLTGSSGDNVFLEVGGSNVLTGGGGHDTFAFNSSLTGTNYITDFNVNDDKLAIFGDANEAQHMQFTQTSMGTMVTFDNTSGSILLAGVNTADLMAHSSTDLFTAQSADIFHQYSV
jgi:Ca2+-binding RTX toxin-like protein